MTPDIKGLISKCRDAIYAISKEDALFKKELADALESQQAEIERLKNAAEVEFQRAEGKKEMKRWFQEQLVQKEAELAEEKRKAKESLAPKE